jgi:hypothetical protein
MAIPADRNGPSDCQHLLPGSGAGANRPRSERLAHILEMGLRAPIAWRPEELQAVLEYQLAAPLQFDLGGLDPGLAAKLRTLSAAEGLLLNNLRDLFRHPHPPVDLLLLVKGFAKSSSEYPDSPYPREVALVLYYLSIAVARLRCQARITNLADEQLRTGLDWTLGQSWVDEASRELLAEARQVVAGARGKDE